MELRQPPKQGHLYHAVVGHTSSGNAFQPLGLTLVWNVMSVDSCFGRILHSHAYCRVDSPQMYMLNVLFKLWQCQDLLHYAERFALYISLEFDHAR